jgi:hypothetical protein
MQQKPKEKSFAFHLILCALKLISTWTDVSAGGLLFPKDITRPLVNV